MDCAAKFAKEVAAIPGVTRADLNFAAAKLTVEGIIDLSSVTRVGSRHAITTTVEGVKSEEKSNNWQQHWMPISSGVSGTTLLAGWLLHLLGASESAVISLFVITIIIGGYSTVRKAFFAFQRLEFDIDVLMSIAVIGAVGKGQCSEGAVVAFLFSVSNTLETYTMEKARQSIRELMDITPKEATVKRNNHELILPVGEILVGDILIVKPGEKIAIDGQILQGSSAVNQAAITGESIPVEKAAGDEVFAGTINQDGALLVLVTKLVNDTTIAKIIHMVEEAQAQKAPSQKFIDRFAAIYTPFVLVLAAAIVVVPPVVFGLPWSPWIYRGLTMLVVSCPCALVVSTPVALVTAIANAAKNGVLIKGGVYLEEAGALKVLAFDKTGTLTSGTPSVTDIIAVGSFDKDTVLAQAAALEQLSEHPLARAIVSKAGELKLAPAKAENFTAITGKGGKGEINGELYFIGNAQLFTELGAISNDNSLLVSELQSQGKTVIAIGTAKAVTGIIAVADKVRETSKAAIAELRQNGVELTVMLTGDNPGTAAAIAKTVDIDEFYAELLPENKVQAVQSLLEKYGKVAMVGDGINDAPALATATLGIAMGAAGTDTALETADVALMADDLTKLPFLIRLSKACLRVIKQNVYFSIGIKLLALVLIFPGWLTLWLAIMADMGASVLVTLNGIRLARVKP